VVTSADQRCEQQAMSGWTEDIAVDLLPAILIPEITLLSQQTIFTTNQLQTCWHYSPIPTYNVAIPLTFDKLKIGIPVTPALGNVYPNFGFSTPSNFLVRSLYVTG